MFRPRSAVFHRRHRAGSGRQVANPACLSSSWVLRPTAGAAAGRSSSSSIGPKRVASAPREPPKKISESVRRFVSRLGSGSGTHAQRPVAAAQELQASGSSAASTASDGPSPGPRLLLARCRPKRASSRCSCSRRGAMLHRHVQRLNPSPARQRSCPQRTLAGPAPSRPGAGPRKRGPARGSRGRRPPDAPPIRGLGPASPTRGSFPGIVPRSASRRTRPAGPAGTHRPVPWNPAPSGERSQKPRGDGNGISTTAPGFSSASRTHSSPGPAVTEIERL